MSRRSGIRRSGAAGAAGAAGALDSTAATPPVRPPGPVRTCVGCRERAARADLLRVVADGGRLVPDPARRLPGRGASVHPDLRCVDLADKRRAFPRALRLPGPLDASDLRDAVRDAAPQADRESPDRPPQGTQSRSRTAPPAAPPEPPITREQVEKPHERSMSQHR